jgi:hypothetical protein
MTVLMRSANVAATGLTELQRTSRLDAGGAPESPAPLHRLRVAEPRPSLRDRLAEFFRAGHNGSDRELAARFGASVGSISVYRCQLKKLGVGVASPPVARGAVGRARRRAAALPLAPVSDASAVNIAEIDQVLVQSIESELALIVTRYPDLSGPVANVQRTVKLLQKFRHP